MDVLDARFATYVGVMTVLIVTPGPDMALVTRNALAAGVRAASLTAFGVELGSIAWALASLVGVAVLLESSVVAFTIFKLAGAAYLCLLGLWTLTASLRRPANAVAEARALGDAGAFRQGVLGNLLNPKAGAIFATVVPQFIVPGDRPLRFLLMLCAYELVLLAWLNLYGRLVSRAGRSPAGAGMRNWAERVTGAVLLGLGVRLAFERR